jgi:hypothetical protein
MAPRGNQDACPADDLTVREEPAKGSARVALGRFFTASLSISRYLHDSTAFGLTTFCMQNNLVKRPRKLLPRFVSSRGTLGRRGSRATQKPLPGNIERGCTKGGTGIPDARVFLMWLRFGWMNL